VVYFDDWCGDHKLDETKLEEESVPLARPTARDRFFRLNALAMEGLTVDGGHHKQWYLERILQQCGKALELNEPQEGDWEKGIAP
jgi:hypothetical protein